MRKALSAALLALAIFMLSLTSCASSSKSERTYSEEDCTYTLRLVLGQATDRAIPDMFLAMNEYRDSMVMDEYAFLNDLRQTVPGMDRLLREWELDVTTSVIPSFDIFSLYLENMADEIQFENPVSLVRDGAASISSYILDTQSEQMVMVVKDHLTDLDVSAWRKVAIQYNSWANTREKLYNETAPRIDADMSSSDIITLLSRRLVEIYISYLSSAEIMIRTTPNADMDPVAARVLGLE